MIPNSRSADRPRSLGLEPWQTLRPAIVADVAAPTEWPAALPTVLCFFHDLDVATDDLRRRVLAARSGPRLMFAHVTQRLMARVVARLGVGP